MNTTKENLADKKAQEIFGGNANDVKQRVFNKMKPARVKIKGRDWELTGMNFKTTLKENAEDGWTYEENGKELSLKSEGMAWDGQKVKTKAAKVTGQIKELEVKYENAFGEGIDIKIIQDNYRLQKIIEIESLASLGEIPEGAEYLEFSFRLSGDFNLPEGKITDRIPFGENSFLLPIRAWDNSETPENPEDEIQSGAFGEINGKIITKKIPVAWLREATFPVLTDTTITYGSENVFSSTTCTYISVAALDSTHFVVAYQDLSNSAYGTAIVGVISGTTISSYGSANVFNSADTDYNSVSALDSTHFVVAYKDDGGADYGCARIGLVSGTTISSYGAENVFNSAITNHTAVAALDSTHFVVAYQDVGNSDYGTAKVGTISGTTISSYGSANVFNSAYSNSISVAKLDSTHFVVAWYDNYTSGNARIAEFSGTTISSWGSESVFNASSSLNSDIAALDSTHFVVTYNKGGSSGNARIAEFSGTTISSWGSESVFNASSSEWNVIVVFNNANFAVVYRDNGGDTYGHARVAEVSGTTISSWGTEDTFNAADTEYISAAIIDNAHFVVAYHDDGNSSYGTGIVGSIPAAAGPANLKTLNGIAKASIKTINGVAIASVKSYNGIL